MEKVIRFGQIMFVKYSIILQIGQHSEFLLTERSQNNNIMTWNVQRSKFSMCSGFSTLHHSTAGFWILSIYFDSGVCLSCCNPPRFPGLGPALSSLATHTTLQWLGLVHWLEIEPGSLRRWERRMLLTSPPGNQQFISDCIDYNV